MRVTRAERDLIMDLAVLRRDQMDATIRESLFAGARRISETGCRCQPTLITFRMSRPWSIWLYLSRKRNLRHDIN